MHIVSKVQQTYQASFLTFK